MIHNYYDILHTPFPIVPSARVPGPGSCELCMIDCFLPSPYMITTYTHTYATIQSLTAESRPISINNIIRINRLTFALAITNNQ
jgi:hypothetical protein